MFLVFALLIVWSASINNTRSFFKSRNANIWLGCGNRFIYLFMYFHFILLKPSSTVKCTQDCSYMICISLYNSIASYTFGIHHSTIFIVLLSGKFGIRLCWEIIRLGHIVITLGLLLYITASWSFCNGRYSVIHHGAIIKYCINKKIVCLLIMTDKLYNYFICTDKWTAYYFKPLDGTKIRDNFPNPGNRRFKISSKSDKSKKQIAQKWQHI